MRLLAIILVLVCFGCKKTKNSQQPSTGNFQPVGTGSQWNYSVSGTSNYTYRLTAADRDSIIDGRSYRVLDNTNGFNEYHFKNGGDYFRFTRQPELNFQPVDLLYLKDYLQKGQEWQEIKNIRVDVSGFGNLPIRARLTVTVMERDMTMEVNGITYRNVIHVKVRPEFAALVVPVENVSDIHYYYAEGVGLIYNRSKISIPLAGVQIDAETKLLSATIR